MKRPRKVSSSTSDHHDASRIESQTAASNSHAKHKLIVKSMRKKNKVYCCPCKITILLSVLSAFVITYIAMKVATDTPIPFISQVSHRMIPSSIKLGPTWMTPIIHIVNTRFMQHQGNLTTLATARLHLFRAICLPSMLHQKNQNFLWIIKVDPYLDVQIMTDLLRILHEDIDRFEASNIAGKRSNDFISLRERIFVIESNTNFLTGHNLGAWRGGKESQEILSHSSSVMSIPKYNGNSLHFLRRTRNFTATQSGIRSGNIELLQKAKESEPYRIILETRLDADDGLHSNFVEHVQNDALGKFGSLKAPPSSFDALKDLQGPNHLESYKWYYWCTESHLKWYPHGNGERGQLDGEKRSNFCITPGLTVGFNVGTLVEHVPQYGHHELYQKLLGHDECKNTKFSKQVADERLVCLSFVKGFVGAVRSRTETSAGMADIQMVKEKNGRSQQDLLWHVLWNSFGVLNDTVTETKSYFDQNKKKIARENLEGQCRGDHSCKVSSGIQLNRIINGS